MASLPPTSIGCPRHPPAHRPAPGCARQVTACAWQAREGEPGASGTMPVCPPLASISRQLAPSSLSLLPPHRSPQSPPEAPSSTRAPSRATASGSSAFRGSVTSVCPWERELTGVEEKCDIGGVEDRGPKTGVPSPLWVRDASEVPMKAGDPSPEISTVHRAPTPLRQCHAQLWS